MLSQKNKHFYIALLRATTVLLLSNSSLSQARRHNNPFRDSKTLPPDPLYYEGCGKAKPIDFEIESPLRLYKSIRIKPEQFPYYVRLGPGYEPPKDRTFFCSGMLISDRHVLTAGHCKDYEAPKDIAVVAGGGESSTPGLKMCRSEKYELWNTGTNDVIGAYHDLALIKLARPIEFSDLIQPVCLPDKPIPPGLQLLSGGKEYNENLCDEPGVVPSIQVNCTGKNIHESVLCAKPNRVDKMQSACPGDSGSPLAGIVDGKWTVFGVASYGHFEDCRFHNNSVTYYANVYNMMNEVKKLFAECG